MPTSPAQESRPTALFLVLDSICRLLIPFALGSLAAFLMTVVAGVAGEEQTGAVDSVGSALDTVLRGSVGVSASGMAAALLVIGYAWTARTVALSTVLKRGREKAGAHPVCPDPRGALPKNPVVGAVAATVALLIFAALASIFFLSQLLSGDTDGELIYPLGAVGSLALIGICIVVLYGMSRLRKWWLAQRLPALNAFQQKPPRPQHDDRFGRFQIAEMILIFAGFAIFFVGVFIRQPGRWQPVQHYGAQGEDTIRVLVLVGAILMGLGMLVVIIRSVARLVVELLTVFGPGKYDGNLTDDGPLDRLFAYAMGAVTIVLEALIALAIVAGPDYPTLQRWQAVAPQWWRPTLIVLAVVIVGTIAAGWSGTWVRNRLRTKA